MTAAAKTTTATAAAMRPHGFCWGTTLTGGRGGPPRLLRGHRVARGPGAALADLPAALPGGPAGPGPPAGRAAVRAAALGLGGPFGPPARSPPPLSPRPP